MGFIQPYLLNDVLKVPAGSQGAVTGRLNVVQEITSFALVMFVGSLSDIIGRRVLAALGFAVMGLGFLLLPLATDITQLTIYRAVFAAGVAIASVMTLSALQDYAQEQSRGTWLGVNGVFTGIALITFSYTLLQMPDYLSSQGWGTIETARATFWTATTIALITALFVRLGYRSGAVVTASQTESVLSGMRIGLAEATRNPRLAVTYAAAFVGRGDLIVITAFLSLWLIRSGADQGIPSEQALATTGMLFAVLNIASMTWSPIFGFILDRINRVTGLCIAMTFAAVAYISLGLVENPFVMSIMIPAIFIQGAAEVSVIVGGNTLLGQEAPNKTRGAIVGTFSLFGTFGIVAVTLVGGEIFDSISYTAPFILVGVTNLVVAAAALIVRLTAGEPKSPEE